jgi:hypothetical protein
MAIRSRGMPKSTLPPVTHRVSPDSTVPVPSVAMKDMMPSFTTRKPLTSPTKAAVTIPASAAAIAGHPWSIDSQATSAPTKPERIPIERSNSPLIAANSRPRAAMARKLCDTSIVLKFRMVGKVSGSSRLKTMSKRTRT